MPRLVAIVLAVVCGAAAWLLPHLRHRLIEAVTTYDAAPSDPAPLPAGSGPALAPAPRVRVVLVDGLAATTAATLPAWGEACKRGATVTMDVGFPTISLPVEVALWSGLTQQQTGIVFRSDRPLVPPLAHGIPAQVPGSIAIAESHGYIVRSLGFADAEPAADRADPAQDVDPLGWGNAWEDRARAAVASDARLVFVHVLRVDSAGHRSGRDSVAYRTAAAEADAIVGELVGAAPDARWFLLSDHGHLPGGGHGGEERAVRQVQACIAGPGIAHSTGGVISAVDMARAIADSVGATLDRASRGRPLSVALAAPLGDLDAFPRLALGPGALAIALVALGLAASSFGVRRWWLAPWWLFAGCALLVAIRGEPTLSTPMVYAPAGRDMYLAWLPALALAVAATWFGLGRTTAPRVVVAQLALPVLATAGCAAACGAWPALAGREVAPVVPRFTAYLSPLLLLTAHGAAAVALGLLGRTVRSAFGRPSRPAPARSARAAG